MCKFLVLIFFKLSSFSRNKSEFSLINDGDDISVTTKLLSIFEESKLSPIIFLNYQY